MANLANDNVQFNDVLSLCVGIWAVNVAQSKSRSNMYTYGVSQTSHIHGK